MSRSPNYPAITVTEAIEDAKTLWDKHNRAVMTQEEAAQSLGYKGLSGTSRPRLAALKKYGILEMQGKGVALTSRAITLAVRERGTSQYDEALRGAVSEVELFRKLLSGHGNASERMITDHLITEENFTRDGAVRAAKAFFAAKKLLDGLGDDTLRDDDAGGTKAIKPGDWVQWTSQGVAQFLEPRKVLGLSEDEAYAFIEGTKAGIPTDQLTIDQSGSPVPQGSVTPPPNPFADPDQENKTPKKGTKHDVFALDSGEVSVRWPEYLTPADFEDIKAWLEILERKIGRSVKRNEPTDSDED